MLRPSRDIVLRSCSKHLFRTDRAANGLHWLVSRLLARSNQCQPLGNAAGDDGCGGQERAGSVADSRIVCPSEYLLDVHRQLRAGAMQHLQLVRNFIRSGMLHMLDLQQLSIGMLYVLELLGRSGRNPGVVPGSCAGMFFVLGKHSNTTGNLCSTADNEGADTGCNPFRAG